MCVILRSAIALAEVLRVASSPEAEYAVVTVNAARELAAARLKSDGYLEVREGAPGVMELRLTPLGLALRAKLQRSRLLGGTSASNGAP